MSSSSTPTIPLFGLPARSGSNTFNCALHLLLRIEPLRQLLSNNDFVSKIIPANCKKYEGKISKALATIVQQADAISGNNSNNNNDQAVQIKLDDSIVAEAMKQFYSAVNGLVEQDGDLHETMLHFFEILDAELNFSATGSSSAAVLQNIPAFRIPSSMSAEDVSATVQSKLKAYFDNQYSQSVISQHITFPLLNMMKCCGKVVHGAVVANGLKSGTHCSAGLRAEISNSLTLTVPNAKTTVPLSKCIQLSYGVVEDIDDYQCDQCNMRCKLQKSTEIWQCKDYVLILLQRFTLDYQTWQRVKIRTPIDYPLCDLDLSPFSLSGQLQENSEQQQQKPLYDLVAIGCHAGMNANGHYYNIVKQQNGSWFKISDANVTPIADTSAVITPDAYLLVYKAK